MVMVERDKKKLRTEQRHKRLLFHLTFTTLFIGWTVSMLLNPTPELFQKADERDGGDQSSSRRVLWWGTTTVSLFLITWFLTLIQLGTPTPLEDDGAVYRDKLCATFNSFTGLLGALCFFLTMVEIVEIRYSIDSYSDEHPLLFLHVVVFGMVAFSATCMFFEFNTTAYVGENW